MNKPTVFSAILIIALLLAATPSQARWMNPQTGRFHTMDTFGGDQEQPLTLHKYLYAADNPVNNVDPSGEEYETVGMLSAMSISSVLFAQISPVNAAAQATARRVVSGRPSSSAFWQSYPDLSTIPWQLNSMVWDMIGGNVGARFGPKAENSCAARVSFGLNYGGDPIPAGTQNAWHNFSDKVYKGQKGDDKYYIVRADFVNGYLTKKWGTPDYPAEKVKTPQDIDKIVASLRPRECAVFATRVQGGHSGTLMQGYQDPFVKRELVNKLDAWILSYP